MYTARARLITIERRRILEELGMDLKLLEAVVSSRIGVVQGITRSLDFRVFAVAFEHEPPIASVEHPGPNHVFYGQHVFVEPEELLPQLHEGAQS